MKTSVIFFRSIKKYRAKYLSKKIYMLQIDLTEASAQ